VAVEWDQVEEWVEAAGEEVGWEDLLPRVPAVIACVRSADTSYQDVKNYKDLP
jgi:hypothetical protein